MYTETKVHNTAGEFFCALCGEPFRQAHACVELIGPDDTSGMVGDICPDCVEAGPAAAAERIRKHAHSLVRKATQWLDFAESVRLIEPGQWATLDDLREAESEAHRQFVAA